MEKEEIIIEHPLPGEKIELVIKRHWIVYVFIFIYLFFGILITITLLFLFFSQLWFYLLLIIFWMSFSLFLYIRWLDHELDLFVITNNRIIGIEQLSLLNRIVSECSLGQVQEVGSQTKGLFANMLNFGTITIQTAGTATNFIMEYAPDPVHYTSKIHNIINTYREIVLKQPKE
ncbi:MAG: hypothetical protein PHN31_06240 [Candidatus Gracilibacteria bacterium]|nr:hypothetical protein [Candidatus Gracilibacteria bacterium]